MQKNIPLDYIPGQYTGNETETINQVDTGSEDSAKAIFKSAKEKLININQWHSLCGFLSPAFQLTDYSGQPVDKEPMPGDYVRIDIPGPGTIAGRGYDWVRVERLTYTQLDENQELFFMQVRPAPHPLSGERQIAHFFGDSSTSSFLLVREISQVTAAVYGRNEVPNTDTQHFVDKVRNQVVGNSGAIGLSAMQWKSLVTAVLKN